MFIFKLISGLIINMAIFGGLLFFAGRYLALVASLGIPGRRFCLLCSDGD